MSTLFLFHPNFGVFPLDEIADVVAPRCEDPTLIIPTVNFELVQPICSLYLNLTDRQTIRRTYGRLTIAVPRYAHSVSRRKKF